MTTICLAVNTIYYPKGGGHMWVYLNWALGLQANGCKVFWLEGISVNTTNEELLVLLAELKEKLRPFGLADNIALWCRDDEKASLSIPPGCYSLADAAGECDILINQYYTMPHHLVKRFKRSLLLDIDPGLTQVWMHKKQLNVAPHDIYFTIGETVGKPGALFPSLGINWNYTPPCVALDHWPVTNADKDAAYTTVTHWSMNLWEEDNGELYSNDKKSGFLPYLSLPGMVNVPLELALCLGIGEEDEKLMLEQNGWRVKDSQELTSTPAKYQSYIKQSRGEFSCVKPSCVRFQNAWISDRTICYLAGGKPAIIEHTGPGSFLPDDAGLLRFHNIKEATHCLNEVEMNYEKHCKLARALAEEYFDAAKVTLNLLTKSLG